MKKEETITLRITVEETVITLTVLNKITLFKLFDQIFDACKEMKIDLPSPRPAFKCSEKLLTQIDFNKTLEEMKIIEESKISVVKPVTTGEEDHCFSQKELRELLSSVELVYSIPDPLAWNQEVFLTSGADFFAKLSRSKYGWKELHFIARGFGPLHKPGLLKIRDIKRYPSQINLKTSDHLPYKNPWYSGRGSTPAHFCAAYGRSDSLKLLLDHKADPSITDYEKNSVLTVGLEKYDLNVAFCHRSTTHENASPEPG